MFAFKNGKHGTQSTLSAAEYVGMNYSVHSSARPLMDARPHQKQSFFLPNRNASGLVVQKQEDPATRSEFENLAGIFKTKKNEFESYIARFDEIVSGNVPISLKWVKNRWERIKPELIAFFSFDTQQLLNRPEGISKNSLKRLKSKLTWYEKSGDGEKLLESTNTAMEHLAEKQDTYTTTMDRMQGRVNNYLDDSEIESSGMDEKIPGRVDAIKNDPNKEDVPALNQVEGAGPSMSDENERHKANTYFTGKGGAPESWQPYLRGETNEGPAKLKGAKFLNLFGPNTVVMLENYRPPWKKYFASDVFFSQWLTSLGKEQDLSQLPEHFPKSFYRNHIDNEQTLILLGEIVRNEKKNTVIINKSSPYWKPLFATPNAASTLNIINEYNVINEGRGGATYGILNVQIYKDSNKNFALKFITGTV